MKNNAGYQLQDRRVCEHGHWVVLARKQELCPGNPGAWVTWRWSRESGFYSGHYFSLEAKARLDFDRR